MDSFFSSKSFIVLGRRFPSVIHFELCFAYGRGVKLIFARGHISLTVAFKGPHVMLGLYTCNYSLTRGKELGAAAG